MTFFERAVHYAQRVISGEIVACKLTRLACERFLKDLARTDWQWRFDDALATRACTFIEHLPHIKGQWARQRLKITLEDWQVFIVCNLFGWVDKDTGLRRFLTCYLEVARKNAKSTLAAGIALYMLAADGEPGAEVYSAATTGDQARIVFDVARQMVLREADFIRGGIDPQRHGLYMPEDARKFEPLNAEGSTLDGLNPHCTIIDELHAHKRRDVYDVLDTARGARDQSLLASITTAGSDRAGICYEQRTYVVKVLEGVFADERYFGVIYTLDDQPYTDRLYGLPALKELEKTCTCGCVHPTLIAQSWREVCAKHATTESVEKTLSSGALSTQIDLSGHVDYAVAATSSFCSTETLNENSEALKKDPNGLKKTAISALTQTNGGVIEAENRNSSNEQGLQNTVSPKRSTKSSTMRSQEDAQYATRQNKTYAWITATAQELFGDSSVHNATLQLAFSETLRKVYSAHSATCKTRELELKGDTLLVKREPDDWTDPAVWPKANPNYGVSVLVEDFERSAREAMNKPSAQNNFLTKRLNVWVNADSAWMDMRAWDRCANPDLKIEDFEGEDCIAAFDLASKVDIAARIMLFRRDKKYFVFGRYYLPEQAAEDGRNSQYSGWSRLGKLVLTDGNVVDYERIESDLLEDAGRFQITEVPYDPFQAMQFSQRMMAEGINMVEMRATVLNFSEPMKELEKIVLEGNLEHDGDPVLTWMVSNVVCHRDVKDNIYPRKEREENKIDGVVALIMALGREMASSQAATSSFWESAA